MLVQQCLPKVLILWPELGRRVDGKFYACYLGNFAGFAFFLGAAAALPGKVFSSLERLRTFFACQKNHSTVYLLENSFSLW